MYSFNVNEKIEITIKNCIKDLSRLNIPISKNISFIECSGYSRCGWCDKKGKDEYIIAINKGIVFEKDLKETIIHELLHTIDYYCGHGKLWKQYAKICSKELGTDIQTKGNVYISSNNIEKDIKIKHLIPLEQYDFLQDILSNNVGYLFDNIKQICCYLSQKNRDYMFIYLRNNMPYIFYNKEYYNYAKVIDKFASKQAKHQIACQYMNGDYDYLSLCYQQWVDFSSVWALTKDYVDCNTRYCELNNLF